MARKAQIIGSTTDYAGIEWDVRERRMHPAMLELFRIKTGQG